MDVKTDGGVELQTEKSDPKSYSSGVSHILLLQKTRAHGVGCWLHSGECSVYMYLATSCSLTNLVLACDRQPAHCVASPPPTPFPPSTLPQDCGFKITTGTGDEMVVFMIKIKDKQTQQQWVDCFKRNGWEAFG